MTQEDDDEVEEEGWDTSVLGTLLGGVGVVAAGVAGIFGALWWQRRTRRQQRAAAAQQQQAHPEAATAAEAEAVAAARRRWRARDAAHGVVGRDAAQRGAVLRATEEAAHIDRWRAPPGVRWGGGAQRDFRAPLAEGGAGRRWGVRALAGVSRLSAMQQFVALIVAAAVTSLLVVLAFLALETAAGGGGGGGVTTATLAPLVAAAAATAPLFLGIGGEEDEDAEGGEEETSATATALLMQPTLVRKGGSCEKKL